MNTNAVNDEIILCIKSAIAGDMIKHLEDTMVNISVNTLDFPEYNKTKLDVEEYLGILRFLKSKMISILHADYVRYRKI